MINFDVMKALEALPIWKRVSALPDRVDALERRLQALEASRAAVPSSGACRFCHGSLRVIDEQPHPDFGFAGMKVLTLQCQNPSCGKTTTKNEKD
nr:hypothetical protein [uncultured Brevundimonas sp.]